MFKPIRILNSVQDQIASSVFTLRTLILTKSNVIADKNSVLDVEVKFIVLALVMMWSGGNKLFWSNKPTPTGSLLTQRSALFAKNM